MKSLSLLLLAAVLALPAIGCRAHGEVDTDDTATHSRTVKTTVREPSGDVKVRTERSVER